MTDEEFEKERQELSRIVEALVRDEPPEEDAPVPAKKKPGPKGRSGGAAADL